jgi:hypothetical protein
MVWTMKRVPLTRQTSLSVLCSMLLSIRWRKDGHFYSRHGKVDAPLFWILAKVPNVLPFSGGNAGRFVGQENRPKTLQHRADRTPGRVSV